MNVFLFYGNQITSRFPEIINSWKPMLDNQHWNDCCFILLSKNGFDDNAIPEDLRPMIAERSRTLTQLGANAGATVGHFVSGMITGPGRILLHCVCSNLDNEDLNGAELKQFIDSFRNYFVGHPNPIIYLTLSSQPATLQKQTRFVTELYSEDFFSYSSTYFLSDTNEHMARVPYQQQLRMLICELALIIKNARILSNGTIYSLGYSVLNANNSELSDLETKTIVEGWLRNAVSNLTVSPDKKLWTLMTGQAQAPNDVNFREVVSQWIRQLTDGLIRFPGEIARRNNRILGALYSASSTPERMKSHILKFFELNNSSAHFDDVAKTFFNDCLDKMLCDPHAAHLNNPSTKAFLKDICDILKEIADVPIPRFEGSPTPQKKFLESVQSYTDRCCEQFENDAYEYCKKKAVHIMAGYMLRHINKIINFVSNVSSPEPLFSQLCIPFAEHTALCNKYPNIHNQISNALLTSPQNYQALLDKRTAPLFDTNGQPLIHEWKQIIESAVFRLHIDLHVYNPTFLSRLNKECPTANALETFIDTYIKLSSMVLRYAGAGGGAESKYLVDDDLQNHPWPNAHGNDVFIVNTDNIERIDRFRINETISALLGIRNRALFPYFSDVDVVPMHDAGEDILQGIAFQHPVQELNEAPPANAIPVEPGYFNMNIAVTHQAGGYVLNWDWPPHTTNMYVRIENEDRLIHPGYPVVGGNALNLHDVTGGELPYGKLSITISGNDNRGVTHWDKKDICGSRDSLSYQLNNVGGNKITLSLQGRDAFLGQVLFQNVVNDQVTLYPLAPSENKTYVGLQLSGNSRLVVNPAISYPCVEIR